MGAAIFAGGHLGGIRSRGSQPRGGTWQGRRGKDSFGGVGATIVDSLDTLWLMGLEDEFRAAQNWTATELTFDR